MVKPTTKYIIGITILVVLHLVGLTLVLNQYYAHLALTPLNLLISASLLLFFHQPLDKRLLAYLIIVCISGFLIEWAGTATGKIFGQYFYGNNLGVKCLDVPIIIGLNWFILSYSSVSLVNYFFKNATNYSFFLMAFLASVCMVALDFFIEQVCAQLDFWYWKGSLAPLENYTAWFLFSFAFNYLLVKLMPRHQNTIGIWLYGLQCLFFISLYLYFY